MDIIEKVLVVIDILYILSDLYYAVLEESRVLNIQYGPAVGGWSRVVRFFSALVRGFRRTGGRLLDFFKKRKDKGHRKDEDGYDGASDSSSSSTRGPLISSGLPVASPSHKGNLESGDPIKEHL